MKSIPLTPKNVVRPSYCLQVQDHHYHCPNPQFHLHYLELFDLYYKY